jgi:hypothetical protein
MSVLESLERLVHPKPALFLVQDRPSLHKRDAPVHTNLRRRNNNIIKHKIISDQQ